MPQVENSVAVEFRNGDRVEVVTLNHKNSDHEFFFVGARGEVIRDTDQHSLLVMFDQDAKGDKNAWWIDGSQLVREKV